MKNPVKKCVKNVSFSHRVKSTEMGFHEYQLTYHVWSPDDMVCSKTYKMLLDRNILRKTEVLYKKECLKTKDLPLKYFETLHVR